MLASGRWAPSALAPQEDDPCRRDAEFDPLCALPAFLPAGVVAHFRVEPDAWTFRLEHALVGGEVLRVVERRSLRAAVDGVARAERLHRRRARPEGACDPLVASVLLHPTVDVIYELPERNPLIYSHAPLRPLFAGSRLRRWLRPPLRHPSLGAGFFASTLPPWNKEAYTEARLPRNAVAWLKALSATKIGRLDEARSTRPLHFLALIHRSAWRDRPKSLMSESISSPSGGSSLRR